MNFNPYFASQRKTRFSFGSQHNPFLSIKKCTDRHKMSGCVKLPWYQSSGNSLLWSVYHYVFSNLPTLFDQVCSLNHMILLNFIERLSWRSPSHVNHKLFSPHQFWGLWQTEIKWKYLSIIINEVDNHNNLGSGKLGNRGWLKT